MEKKDWMQTVADVGSAESVWYENVSVDGGRSLEDYTTWHQRHFGNGESVRELGEKIKKFTAVKRQDVMVNSISNRKLQMKGTKAIRQ